MATTRRFRVPLEKDDKSEGTGIAMPFDVYQVFGTHGRVPVRGTLNGHSFRSTLAPMGGGVHYLPVNKALRDGAKATAGEMVEVIIERDDEPRVILAPPDFARALKDNKAAQAAWDKLSPSHRREYVGALGEAKKPETRARRMDKAVAELAQSGRRAARPASTKPVAQKLQIKGRPAGSHSQRAEGLLGPAPRWSAARRGARESAGSSLGSGRGRDSGVRGEPEGT